MIEQRLRPRRRRAAALAGAIALAALAACGGTDEPAGDASPVPPPAASGTLVTVEETDFALAVSESDLAPGTYTFVVENAGGVDHALELVGPGVEAEIDTIAPGSSAELTVELADGTYELFCPIPGHRESGMALTLPVGTAEPAPEPAPAGGGVYG